MKRSISIRIDDTVITKIDSYAKSRNFNRTQAISFMLKNTKIFELKQGAEILILLHSIEILLKKSNLSNFEKKDIEGCCHKIWQLLNLITEEIQNAPTEPIN